MNAAKSSSELKAIAKGQLLGNYGITVPAFLIIAGFSVIISAFLSGRFNTATVWGFLLFYLSTFLIQLILAVFAVGESRLYLNIACKQPFKVSDIFYGFGKHADKAIVVRLLLGLISFVSMIPALVTYFLSANLHAGYLLPVAALLLIVGLAVTIVINLIYSQIPYLILDFPQYSVRELMNASKQLMQGFKGKLFYLRVSFLPLYLLSFFSCCIGYLWIMPYFNAVSVNFYLDIIRIKATPGN